MTTDATVASRKPWTPTESRLVSEWAVATYPNAWKTFNVRVGGGNPTLADSGMDEDTWRGTVGELRRRADLVIYTREKILLVEAKIVAHPVAIGELLLYRQLLPHTPELMGLLDVPIESVLLCAKEDPAVSVIAQQQGITVVLYDPPWVADYLATKAHRARAGKVIDTSLADSSSARSPGGGAA